MLILHRKALATTAALGLIMGAGNALATTSANQPVTLTVQNVVTITPDAGNQLDFGTYTVTSAAAVSATLAMAAADGTLTPTNSGAANFIQVVAPAGGDGRGVFAVAGAPNTVLNVSTSNLVNLHCGACTGGNPDITLTSVTPDSGATVTTNGTGDATINVGALLTTVQTATQYEDGAYAGSYDLTVTY